MVVEQVLLAALVLGGTGWLVVAVSLHGTLPLRLPEVRLPRPRRPRRPPFGPGVPPAAGQPGPTWRDPGGVERRVGAALRLLLLVTALGVGLGAALATVVFTTAGRSPGLAP